MATEKDLRRQLNRIDGKGYKAYKDIRGSYIFDGYTLIIDHVQGDPFAVPSRVRVRVPRERAGFAVDLFVNRSREIALRDFLTRCFYNASRRFSKGNRGTGKSGLITIDCPGQEILERTTILIDESAVEARFTVGLPAFRRKIAGRQAEEMFFGELPAIVRHSLVYENLAAEKISQQVETAEDADSLRRQLADFNCLAFVADGAVLPRRSGIDPRPLGKGKYVPFKSPESYRIEIDTPNAGRIAGMGIPEGITLIVGGGYHGKSTLLSSLELGIYNHIPGDGREFVVSHFDTLKIRAEDGRRVEKVAITPFISNLPFQKDTTAFSTEDASGSTSQAANIMEVLELGARTLLIDEDTSATNFMIRDQRMQELVLKDSEPITPFIDKVRQLYRELGVSSVLVIGGSGEYFDVADNVICMQEYLPTNVTEQALEVSRKHAAERQHEGGDSFGRIVPRIPRPASLNPRRGKHAVKISEKGLQTIAFGTEQIDLGGVEQLVDTSQTRAIGDAMMIARTRMGKDQSLRTVVERIAADIEIDGLAALNSHPFGHYAQFRPYELAAAINRLRTLVVDQK